MFLDLRLRLSRLGRLPRLAAALVCALLAGVSALGTGGGAADRDAAPVVVATRTLPIGHVLTAGDLTVARWPRRLVPADAAGRLEQWRGRRLAAPVTAREALTAGRLWGRDLTAGLGADVVAVSVAIDSSAARLVHAGDRVDLLAVAYTPGQDLPGGTAPVAQAPDTAASGARVLGSLPGGSAEPTASLVLAVSRPIAVRIIALRGSRVFTIVASAP